MNYSRNLLVADDMMVDGVDVDEIDALFGQLEQIVPPSTLVESILASVARLAPTVQYPTTPTQKIWESYPMRRKTPAFHAWGYKARCKQIVTSP